MSLEREFDGLLKGRRPVAAVDDRHGVVVELTGVGPRKYPRASFDVQPSGALLVFDAASNEMIGTVWASGYWRYAETYCEAEKPCPVCTRHS